MSDSTAGEKGGDSWVGRVLQDRYRLQALIAEGGMGTVYRAERVQLGRPVAIKVIHAAMAQDPKVRRRFEVEARAMGQLAHPNCVAVIDFGVDGLPYLVMDFVQGITLRRMLDDGPLPPRRALRIASQILAALAHAHALGIVHRDIKPENVVIEQAPGLTDHVRVLDFGLAKLLGSDMGLTTGMVLGTPNYMAPEQAGAGAIDARVDVYATGIVLFEMLSGKKPFDSQDLGEVFRGHLGVARPKIREIAPLANLSAEVEALVLRAMARNADDRFPSAAAMAEAVAALPENRMEQPGPAPVAVEQRRAPSLPVPARGALAPPPQPTIQQSAPSFLPVPAGAPPVPAPVASPRKKTAPAARLRAALLAVVGRVQPVFRSARAHPRRVVVAVAVVLGVAMVVALASRDPSPPVASREPAAPSKPSPPEPAKASAPVVPSDRDQEIAKAVALRASEPGNAERAAALARLYFEKFWWSDGLAAFRDAIRLDPRRKEDAVLIGHVISSLQSDKFRDRAAAFLRELGPAARPQLQEAAKNHPNPRVRARAAEIVKPAKRGFRWPWQR